MKIKTTQCFETNRPRRIFWGDGYFWRSPDYQRVNTQRDRLAIK
ncbi:hypothetical protein [Coleofasciculus sp. H7-2]